MNRIILEKNLGNEILINNAKKLLIYITLNRTSKLNTLSLNMIKNLIELIPIWNKSNIKTVIFKGAGEKAFCAGADIKSLYESKRIGNSKEIFEELLRNLFFLNYQLKIMKPIQICIFNGIVFGAGVEISMFAPVKIATENSLFAMPDAKVGFFVESYFLPRLKKKIGYFIALTGFRLQGKELVQAGLANCFIKKEKLMDFQKEIEEKVTDNTNFKDILSLTSSFSVNCGNVLENENYIEKFFNYDSFEEMFINLKKEAKTNKLSEVILKMMNDQSPLSLRIIWEQMKRGEKLTIEECLQMDFGIGLRFAETSEFFEGVRTVLIEKKSKPNWMFSDPLNVDQKEIESYFVPVLSERKQKIVPFYIILYFFFLTL